MRGAEGWCRRGSWVVGRGSGAGAGSGVRGRRRRRGGAPRRRSRRRRCFCNQTSTRSCQRGAQVHGDRLGKKNGGIWFIVELATSMGIWSGPRKNAARAAHREQPSKRGYYKASRWSEGSVVAHGFGLGGFVSTGQGSSQGLVSALAWPWPLGVRQRWHGLGGQALWQIGRASCRERVCLYV